MGRRPAVATVASGVDSSPSSTESSFREVDDVFLQTQTRIWLGEVLKIRLDEQLHISDLLADGELLFEVSKLVWNMLLGKCAELRHVKVYPYSLGSRKSSGRYLPYSNVDNFLKLCKILGLSGIDLFSPSDVVEKRDIRKVCICIRALSKKARSKQLQVPDFDVVSYTVSMPTEMVGCIRRSLESSQCSFSSSSSHNSRKDKRSIHQLKTSISECDGNYDSSSDVSDEAESKYLEFESFSSPLNKFGNPATLSSPIGDSSDSFSAVKQYATRKSVPESDMRNLCTDFIHSEPMSSSLLQSMNSLSSNQSTNEHHADSLPSSCIKKPLVHFHSMHSHVNIDQTNCNGSSLELTDVDSALRKEASSLGNFLFDSNLERDFISDYLAFSDSVVLGTDGNSPVFFDGEDNIRNFFMGFDSHQSHSSRGTFQNGFHQKSSDDMEDVEVSSCTSMSSILGRVLNMDFDGDFDVGISSTEKVNSLRFLEKEVDSQDKGSVVEDQSLDVAQFETSSHVSATDIIESQLMEHENVGCPHEFFSSCQDNMESPSHGHYVSFPMDPRDSYSLKDTNITPSKNDQEISVTQNVGKIVTGDAISKSYPQSIQEAHHILLDSPQYQTLEALCIRSNTLSVEGEENCSSNLQYQHTEILDATCERLQKIIDGIHGNEDLCALDNKCEVMEEQQANSIAKGSGFINVADQEESIDCHQKEGKMPLDQETLSENDLGGRKDIDSELKRDKGKERPLLKTFVRGTAVIGAVFLFLHVSKRSQGRTDQPSEQLSHARNSSSSKSSSEKRQRRTSGGTYSTGKLNFGK